VSAQDMQDLQNWQAARRKQATTLELFQAHFAKADAQLTPAAAELTDEDVVRMVKESR
jgi:antitoxin Phd